MIGRVVGAVLLLVTAAVLLVALWPQLFGLQAAPIVAQVVALRGVDVGIAIALIVLFGLVAIGWREARRFLGGLVALLAVFCLLSLAILGSRGFGSEPTAKTNLNSGL